MPTLSTSRQQVGVVAMRSKNGEFLPAQPIYRDVPDNPAQAPDNINQDFIDMLVSQYSKYVSQKNKIKNKKEL